MDALQAADHSLIKAMAASKAAERAIGALEDVDGREEEIKNIVYAVMVRVAKVITALENVGERVDESLNKMGRAADLDLRLKAAYVKVSEATIVVDLAKAKVSEAMKRLSNETADFEDTWTSILSVIYQKYKMLPK